MNGDKIDADWTGTLATNSVLLTDVNEKAAAPGTQKAIDEAKAKLEDGSLQVFDTSTFTVDGKSLILIRLMLTQMISTHLIQKLLKMAHSRNQSSVQLHILTLRLTVLSFLTKKCN